MTFTPNPLQEQVISHRDGSLLVAAAAGSGKTTTLIAHVLDRLKEKDETKRGDLRRMIIVTYTNAAASEMRAKLIGELGEALKEDPDSAWLRFQSEIAPQAHICTVDSLCGFLVRNYFDKIDLSPDLRIADKSELALLKDDVLDALLEAKYAENDEDFRALVTDYSSEKGDRNVRDLVKKLYDTAQNAVFPDEWLAEAEKPQPEDEEAFWKQDWIKDCERDLKDALRRIRGRIEYLEQLVGRSEAPRKGEYLVMLAADKALMDSLLAEDFQHLQERFGGKLGWMDKPKKNAKKDTAEDQEIDELIKDERGEKYKKKVGSLAQFYGRRPGWQFSLVRLTEKPKRALIALAREYTKLMREAMKERGIADFIDVEHHALDLLIEKTDDGKLVRTDTAKMLAAEFDEIIIDEYQDINNVQDELLRALSREEDGIPNLFMVGDVKQSIYRFRRANPEIFLRKYKSFSGEEGASHRKIDLSSNYRSRKEIVDGVNDVFRRIMDEPFGGIAYDEKAQLNFGAAYYDENGHVPEILLSESDDVVAENRRVDADRIGRKILELTESGTLNGGRPVRFRDIRILMRVMTDARLYVDTLADMGIPAVAPLKHGFYDTEEVKTVLALLKAIDNPRQDIPLAAVMTSPFGGFSDSELADLAVFAKQEAPEASGLYERLKAARDRAPERFGKTVVFLEKLEKWRDLAEMSTIPELIHALMTESGYELYLRAMPGGMSRLANLEALLDKAEAYENSSYRGLFQFNRYMEYVIDRIQDGTDEGESAPVQDDDDVVHIDTIHSSKGLQYPVVILADASRSFDPKDAKGRVLVHEKEGVALESRDEETRQKLDNLRKTFVANRIKDELKEEQLRLLYVAMTRAEEYLFVSGAVGENWREKYAAMKGLPDGPLPAYAVRNGDSYLDWILMAAAAGTPHLKLVPESAGARAEKEKKALRGTLGWEDLRQHMEDLRNDPPEIPEELDKRVHFRYPHEALAGVRGIYTVSSLKKMAQAQEDAPAPLPSVTAEEAETGEAASGKSGVTGADRGTVYHKIMEHLDISHCADEAAAAAQIAAMKQGGLLTEEEAAAVPADEVSAFFDTPLGARVIAANAKGLLFREQPFIQGVALGEISDDHPGSRERVLIQGIIDLYFEEDGKLFLIDYKTDRVRRLETLGERYRLQLEYYRKALEQAAGKPVAGTFIYSTVLKKFLTLE